MVVYSSTTACKCPPMNPIGPTLDLFTQHLTSSPNDPETNPNGSQTDPQNFGPKFCLLLAPPILSPKSLPSRCQNFSPKSFPKISDFLSLKFSPIIYALQKFCPPFLLSTPTFSPQQPQKYSVHNNSKDFAPQHFCLKSRPNLLPQKIYALSIPKSMPHQT